jgi:hypothetical protein
MVPGPTAPQNPICPARLNDSTIVRSRVLSALLAGRLVWVGALLRGVMYSAPYGFPGGGGQPPPNPHLQSGSSPPQPQQMMYNPQQYPMGSQGPGPFQGGPNMMPGAVAGPGMMANAGMPHNGPSKSPSCLGLLAFVRDFGPRFVMLGINHSALYLRARLVRLCPRYMDRLRQLAFIPAFSAVSHLCGRDSWLAHSV